MLLPHALTLLYCRALQKSGLSTNCSSNFSIFSSTYYSKAYTTTSSSFKHHQWTAHCEIQPWIFNSYLIGTICSIYNLSFLKYFLALFLVIPGCLYLLSISSDHFAGSHPPYFPNTLLSLSISKHWSSQELVFRLLLYLQLPTKVECHSMSRLYIYLYILLSNLWHLWLLNMPHIYLLFLCPYNAFFRYVHCSLTLSYSLCSNIYR